MQVIKKDLNNQISGFEKKISTSDRKLKEVENKMTGMQEQMETKDGEI